MIIYVDASVIQTGNGTKENPFKTIQGGRCKGHFREMKSSLHRDYTVKLLIRFTLERQTSVSPTVLQ